ncbi:MAG TPA: hypothetical protein VF845_10720 [Terriglobales bacterium]
MLVIISDLHLTDGSSGDTIQAGAFFLLRERLRSLAYDASWRKPDVYRPLERIDLLLLGDILDVIRSTLWCGAPPQVRPWGDPNSAEFVKMISTINDGILVNNAKSLSVIRSLSKEDAITVPKALENSRPATDKTDYTRAADRVVVPVYVHYLVGNHDWFYHLPGSPYDVIRATVVAQMGLANLASQPFPHDPNEYPELLQIYAAHRVFARHGDIFDSSNYDGDRNKSSLGDAIVVELLNRFPDTVRQRLGTQLSSECLSGLKEIDNVRPLVTIPSWIEGLLRRTCSEQQGKAVKEIWNGLVDRFLEIEFVKAHKSALKWALKFSQGISLATLSKGLLWAEKKFGIGNDGPFYPNALNEKAFKDRTAAHFVYGHTHLYEIVTLRASEPRAGIGFDQVYVNSGTWRAVHELAVATPKEEQFVGYNVMTYLVFYKDDERTSRGFESWSGALGNTT